MNIKQSVLLLTIYCVFVSLTSTAQFLPVPLGGFNHDVVAETGNSSLTTTTVAMDGVPASNNVMYTLGFASANAFGGGGLPDNGLIADAAGSYQMASYTGNNALIVPRNQNGDLNLNTPASFSKIRLLCLSTEGSALVNIKLFFTDGSSTNALNNATINDWFNASANTVISGFGRCVRATPATSASAYPSNPKMFYLEVALSCADAQKTLQKINVANVTTAGTNAPFPNAIFFAVSGKTNSRNVISAINNATCAVNGSATLTITGSAAPYTVSWNTTPVQTGLTATNLPVGNYVATITDANTCTSTYNVGITLDNNLSVTAHVDTTICRGASFAANTISNATTYSWSPTTGVSNPNIANPTLSPTTTTTYTVTATLGSCNLSRTFTVTVDAPTISPRADTTICNGASFIPNISGNATSYTWSPTTGVSNPNIANPVLSPTTTTTYTATGSLGGCTSTRTFTVTVSQSVTVDAGAPSSVLEGYSTQLQGSGTSGTYLWSPASSLSSATVSNPIASPVITTQYYLTITTPAGCTNTDSVLVTVVPYCIKPLNAFSPNGDGINEYWLVTNNNCTSNVNAYVFNRYGTKVYESNDYQNNWNGTYKGKPLPDGTYYYILNFTLINGKKITLKGNVTIIR
jgi:gliding motility-associated-like protein